MDKIKYLSHEFDEKVPVYGGKEELLEIFREKSIGKGDSCNTFKFRMGNHWGTHIDAPAHFFDNAMAITGYPAGSLVFKSPCVINLPLKSGREIKLGEVKDKIKARHDLVLIKTGFGRHRGSREYGCEGPSVGAEVGSWLRDKRPKLRAIGFDFISIASPGDKVRGKLSHRAFLDPAGKGSPILIIEDMDLSRDLSGLKVVWAAPLLIRGIDSSPCTVMGVFAGKNKRGVQQ